jgi:hypothetical protein
MSYDTSTRDIPSLREGRSVERRAKSMFIYLGEREELIDSWTKPKKIPFALLQINNPIRPLEAMPRTVHGANASCSVTLRKLGMGLVHGMEA